MHARFPIILLLAAACGSSGPSAPLDIAGTWSFSDSVSNSTLQVSCKSAGSLTVNQAGSQFTGTYSTTLTCTGPGINTSTPGSGSVSNGTLDGRHATFDDDAGCHYTGAVAGLPTNVMSGTSDCTINLSGTAYPFTGTWSGIR